MWNRFDSEHKQQAAVTSPPSDHSLKHLVWPSVYGDDLAPSFPDWRPTSDAISDDQSVTRSVTNNHYRSISQWLHQQINQWQNQSIKVWINQSMTESTNRSMTESIDIFIESINQWLNQSINQWLTRSIMYWINDSIDQSVGCSQWRRPIREWWRNVFRVFLQRENTAKWKTIVQNLKKKNFRKT